MPSPGPAAGHPGGGHPQGRASTPVRYPTPESGAAHPSERGPASDYPQSPAGSYPAAPGGGRATAPGGDSGSAAGGGFAGAPGGGRSAAPGGQFGSAAGGGNVGREANGNVGARGSGYPGPPGGDYGAASGGAPRGGQPSGRAGASGGENGGDYVSGRPGGRAAAPGSGDPTGRPGGYAGAPDGENGGGRAAASGDYGVGPGGEPVGGPAGGRPGAPNDYRTASGGEYRAASGGDHETAAGGNYGNPGGGNYGTPGGGEYGTPGGGAYRGAGGGDYGTAGGGYAGGQRPAVGQPGGPATAGTGRLAGVGGAGLNRKRTFWVFGLAVLILAVAGLVFVVRPGPVDGWLAADSTASPAARATPEPTPPPVLSAVESGGTSPTANGVKAALDPLVAAKALGTKVNVSVVDAVSGDSLYQRNADTMTTPASTTKLLTAAAVLAARGPAYRLTTRAVAGSAPGEVVLIGGGDPTLSVGSVGQFPGAARLDKLAAQVKKALGTTRPTRVVIDTSLYSGAATASGWDPSDISPGGQVAAIQALMTNAGRISPVHHEVGADPRFSDPALAAGKAFAKQLGVTAAVTRGKAPTSASAPASSAPAAAVAPGAALGQVQSPPLVQVIDWMLQQSDNVIAETMGRQVALAAGKPASFEGATDAIVAKLGELGLPGDEADLYDASGLSRHNGISPALLTDVLALAAGGKQPALSSLFGGLPVAGWSGTLQTRFATPSPNKIAQGIVRAKTGSLSGVNTMAGELITKDGRLLVFAIMANGSADAVTARAALDRVAARLVGCGCG
jgi:serine-type D-Ala-D-Ala carboxypeptidase/endopeptidase (penicillin-binding protein 4)